MKLRKFPICKEMRIKMEVRGVSLLPSDAESEKGENGRLGQRCQTFSKN